MESNAKGLYNALTNDNKHRALDALSREFYMNPKSIRNFWLNPTGSIPDKKVGRVVEILQNAVRSQIKSNQKLVS